MESIGTVLHVEPGSLLLSQPVVQTRTEQSLFLFWVPLALMWLVMGIEQPALNAVMARLPNATQNLAAFEIAFGLALLIESPILQMLSAATALVNGPLSYRRLTRFMGGWAIVLTAVHFLVSRPVVFRFIAGQLLATPPHIVEEARFVFVLLIPFAALVGYRRLWQGALIRAGKTGRVGLTMIVRLCFTIGVLVAGVSASRVRETWALDGHYLAAIALMAGVAAGAGASFIAQRRPIYDWFSTITDQDEQWSLRRLLAFYIPLSTTSIMALAARPLLAFGMNRSALPVVSLAAWPSVQGFLFLFTSIALSYQEAVVARSSASSAEVPALRRFAIRLAACLSLLFAATILTGGLRGWFSTVVGLAPQLVSVAVPSASLLLILPAVVTARSFLSGSLVAVHQTKPLSLAVGLNVLVLFLGVLLLPVFTPLVGAIVASISFVSANLVQVGALSIAHGRRRSVDLER